MSTRIHLDRESSKINGKRANLHDSIWSRVPIRNNHPRTPVEKVSISRTSPASFPTRHRMGTHIPTGNIRTTPLGLVKDPVTDSRLHRGNVGHYSLRIAKQCINNADIGDIRGRGNNDEARRTWILLADQCPCAQVLGKSSSSW